MRHFLLLGAVFLLSGCVVTDGGPSGGYNSGPGYSGSSGQYHYSPPYPSRPNPYTPPRRDDRLSDRQEDALEQGCAAKYGSNKSKRKDCARQQTDGWHDALIKGCKTRYARDERRLRQCLAGAF